MVRDATVVIVFHLAIFISRIRLALSVNNSFNGVTILKH